MKKLLMLVTMLLVPALASAWTLPVKVTNTTAGINAGNQATVVYSGIPATAVTTGTKYFYPANTVTEAEVIIANLANVTNLNLDGLTIDTSVDSSVAEKYSYVASSGTLTVEKGNASLHSVIVTYANPASAQTCKVTVTQTANGLTTLKLGQASTTSGWDTAMVGSTIQVVAAPNANATLAGVTLNGVALPAPYIFTVADTTADVVVASYTLKPVVTATLAAPTSGNIGANVSVTVTANNQPGQTIAWKFNGAAVGTGLVTETVGPLVAGQNTIEVTVTATNANTVRRGQYIIGVDTTSVENYQCTSCHASSTPTVISTYANLTWPAVGTTCVACHTSKPHPYSCSKCHTGEPNHAFVAAPAVDSTKTSCIGCHDVVINDHTGTVGNDGVRAIVAEFSKKSHHVTGRAVQDTDCAVCHAEGMKSGTAIVPNPATHMLDGKIYLRNGNTSLSGNQTGATSVGGVSVYAWDPNAASPDHGLMDRFCFSCHNASGAPAAVAAVAGADGYTGTNLNPFGDTVSNDYDQVSRVNVVGVYEQFATTNSSHHAVRGAKYTANTLVGNLAVFNQISTANAANKQWGAAPGDVGIKSIIGTMKDLNKFTATYTNLSGVALADNNTLHCGDCHTVGQFRASDVGVKPFNNAVIGAHGSNNEYMLRNSNGDDTFAKDALVCYICHAEAVYSAPGQTATFNPAGITAHNSVNNSFQDCNGNYYNTAGLVGAARLTPEEGEMDVNTFETEVAEGKYAATGGGNIFGIKCIACHNASDKKTFGGIHGNAGNASYVSYSGAKGAMNGGDLKTVSRKPYRFMPGLGNFRYNGGDSADQWTVKSLLQANKQGCYTLNGASTAAQPGQVGQPDPSRSPTYATAAGANKSTNVNAAIANDNGILGSWGACTDHAGTSVFGGRATTRTILRPLSY